jgi:hypothetical protein
VVSSPPHAPVPSTNQYLSQPDQHTATTISAFREQGGDSFGSLTGTLNGDSLIIRVTYAADYWLDLTLTRIL